MEGALLQSTKIYAELGRNLEARETLALAPFEPIQAILALDNPLSVVADAVRRLDAARPAMTGTGEAVWARDRLVLTLCASSQDTWQCGSRSARIAPEHSH